MKKILFLLLLTVASYGQTYQNPTFGTITSKTSPTVTSPVNLVTQDANGTQGRSSNVVNKINSSGNSGIITFDGLAINADPTKFNLGAGTGYITNSLTGVTTAVSWSAQTAQTTPYLATSVATYVLKDSSGATVLQNSYPTNEQFRTHIYLGKLAHTTFTTISVVVNDPSRSFSVAGDFHDFVNSIGSINIEGNAITPNGANLNINVSAGRTYREGANFMTNRNSPNITNEPAVVATSFRNKFRNGSGGWSAVNTTTVDPNNYDNGSGILQLVPNNKFTIKVVYRFGGSGTIHMDYGQAVYDDMAAADAGIANSVASDPDTKGFASRIGWIIIKQGTTSLLDATKYKFVAADLFGTRAATSAPVATLQTSYDASVTPQIVTNTTGGAVAIRRGSAADSDNILVGQNGAGTNTFSVTGSGVIDFSNKQNSLAVDGTGVKIPTVDAVNYPILAGETGVLNARYFYGDVRRYGIFPDGVTNWEGAHPVKIAAIKNAGVTLKYKLFWPKGLYNTGLNLDYTWSNLTMEFEAGAEFSNILHIVGGGDINFPLQNVTIFGDLVTYDRVGIQNAINVVVTGDLIHKSNTSIHPTGLKGRGCHIAWGVKNFRCRDIIVEDCGTSPVIDYNSDGAIVIDGAVVTEDWYPDSITIRNMWVKKADGNGVYLLGKNMNIKNIQVDEFAKSFYATPRTPEGADMSQGSTFRAVWTNRIWNSRIDRIVAKQTLDRTESSRSYEDCLVQFDDTGVSSYANTINSYLNVGQVICYNARQKGAVLFSDLDANAANNNVVVDYIEIHPHPTEDLFANYGYVVVNACLNQDVRIGKVVLSETNRLNTLVNSRGGTKTLINSITAAEHRGQLLKVNGYLELYGLKSKLIGGSSTDPIMDISGNGSDGSVFKNIILSASSNSTPAIKVSSLQNVNFENITLNAFSTSNFVIEDVFDTTVNNLVINGTSSLGDGISLKNLTRVRFKKAFIQNTLNGILKNASTSFSRITFTEFVNTSASNLSISDDISFANSLNVITGFSGDRNYNEITAVSFNGSATLTGTPTAPTATAGTNTTQIATTAFVQNAVSGGTFTPTLTNVSNIASVSLLNATYTKTGDIVTATIGYTVTYTSNSVASNLRITLPVARSISSVVNIGLGSVSSSGTSYTSSVVQTDSNTTEAIVYSVANGTTSSNGVVTFQYSLN